MATLKKLVLNRDEVLRSLTGHSISFIENIPVAVPQAMYAEALAIGAKPVGDGDEVDLRKPDPDAPPADIERPALILEAIEAIIQEDNRDEFTASGKPSVGAVSDRVGFKVSAVELNAVWQERNESNAE